MPDQPPSNVKIYERPARKGPSPLIMAIALLIVLVVGFFVYKAFYHNAPPVKGQPGFLPVQTAFWQETVNR